MYVEFQKILDYIYQLYIYWIISINYTGILNYKIYNNKIKYNYY